MVGVGPEEIILFAIALDLESGAVGSPLFKDGSIEVGTQVVQKGMSEVIRILIVMKEEKNDAQKLLMM